MDPWLLLALAAASVLAGFVDAIVGGGGIITLPALLAAGVPPHLAIGTNKVAGTGASSVATWQYARHRWLDRPLAWATFPFAVAASVVGAAVVLRLPARFIEVSIVLVIVAIVAWVLARPRFGQEDHYPGRTRIILVAVVGLAVVIGFYDGLLGPGTGMFLLFGLVTLTGMPFLQAAAHGRVLNFGSNIGALGYFAAVGNVDWLLGGVMAAGTVTGGWFGARFAMRHGARWVRWLFLAVAVALLGRLVWGLG